MKSTYSDHFYIKIEIMKTLSISLDLDELRKVLTMYESDFATLSKKQAQKIAYNRIVNKAYEVLVEYNDRGLQLVP